MCLPHLLALPITPIGGHVPLGILGGVGWTTLCSLVLIMLPCLLFMLVLPSHCHAPWCHGMNMVYCYFRRNRVVLVSNLLIPDIHC